MRCVVTGGAGFIGSHLVDRLVQDGNVVIVVDDFFSGKREHLDYRNVVLFERSIASDLSDVFADQVDVVFHVAAIPRVQFSIQEPRETHRANVDGTFNVLMHCKDFGVKRFVFSSSSSVYGDQPVLPLREEMVPNPLSPYAAQKLIGEVYARQFSMHYGIESVCLRYFNVFGPRLNPEGMYACLIPKFIKKIMRGERPTINGDGNQTRDFTYVSDVVDANIRAAMLPSAAGEVFNIGAGRNISVNEVTRQILGLAQKNIVPIYGPAVVEPRDTCADIRKAQELLGWAPKVSFEEGLKLTFEYVKNQPASVV